MVNMSYCRFRNTLEDLKNCAEHIDDSDLSEDEEKARQKLILICRDLAKEGY